MIIAGYIEDRIIVSPTKIIQMARKVNTNVKQLPGDRSKIYCQEDYAQELYDKYYSKMTPTRKDIDDGDILRVTDLRISSNEEDVEATCDNFTTLFFSIAKEKKYLDIIGLDKASFVSWVKSGKHVSFLKEKATYISVENVDAAKGSLYNAHLRTIHNEFLAQIKKPSSAYLATIVSKNQGGFLVEVQGVKAFMPGSLAAANKIVNFDDYIGKEVHVMIEDYLQTSKIFVVSYKKYLDRILPSKLAELERGQLMEGVVTGTSKYGIFVEFQEIYTGLLHTSEMSASTLEAFKENEYRAGDKISMWLKEVRDSKLILTENDPALRESEMEAFRDKQEGLVRNLTVVSVKPFGAFLEVEKGVLGLLPVKEMKRIKKKIVAGDNLNVCIRKVDVATGKIYLSLTSERMKLEV